MVKYAKVFMVQIAERYLTGRDGYQGVAREFGIARELIREWSRLYERWVRRFDFFYTTHSPAFNLKVLNDMATNGLSRMAATLKYRISPVMISN